ncbi:MAG: lipopolysaccharide heptosyltransferase II [Deltaproteobacteria bacterium HGW-Deltaproteobacteria-10]|nr:MAG: lipopolysaccharide heptosyltransferase II [Deltaproteobacteria bacterium HGW-Deltaproteobacteria-10]
MKLKINKKLPPEGIDKILIRATNWIGDAILTIPAVDSIRATYPQAHIAILAKPRVADVYRLFTDINEVIIYEDQYDNARGVLRLARRLRKDNFDLAVLLQNAIEAAIMSCGAGIPRRAGYNSDGRGILLTHRVLRSSEIIKMHQIDYYLEMVKALGCVAVNKEMHLETKINRHDAQNVLKEYMPDHEKGIIGIAPGATFGPAKRWFPERFAAVADKIADACDYRIILLGGKDDWEIAEEVRRFAKTELLNLAGKTNLKEAVYLISQCRLFISNDSGLMHIAGALNIPTIAIFGSTNPQTTSPAGNSSTVVRKAVSCSPCLKKTCPTDFRCMELISVEDVWQTAQKILKKVSSASGGVTK